jgi:hypothetical protein
MKCGVFGNRFREMIVTVDRASLSAIHDRIDASCFNAFRFDRRNRILRDGLRGIV